MHREYEGKNLQTCLLSYYLHETKDFRLSILKWLGSKLVAEDYQSPFGDEPPELWQSLAKIPKGKEGLGDKGFAGTDRFYAWWSKIRTPLLMRGRKVKQYQALEINAHGGKRPVCRLRYTSEVAFARHTIQDGTKDVIPYPNISILPHMHAWGHAMMKLKSPLQKPLPAIGSRKL